MNGNDIMNPQFHDFQEFCNEMGRELQQEIRVIKHDPGTAYHVFNGSLLIKAETFFQYTFRVEEALPVQKGVEVELILKGKNNPISATIVEADEEHVVLAIKDQIPKEIDEAELKINSSFLYEFLNKRLQEMASEEPGIASHMIMDWPDAIHPEQEFKPWAMDAVKMASEQPITFIWGPPGTGKTYTLALIALDCLNSKRRVLIISHTNIAVDGAVLQIKKTLESNTSKFFEEGQIIRYGNAKHPELYGDERFNVRALAEKRNPDLVGERNKLLEERRDCSDPDRRNEINERLSEISKHLRNAEIAILRNASIVATTVASASVSPNIYDVELSQFDTVIFDEASMAIVPYIVFGAGIARKHFVCLGDFNQLPPIVKYSSRSCLNADIFLYTGIASSVEKRIHHSWLCLLDTQHRMHPQIAEFASNAMYSGLLKSEEGLSYKREYITEQPPVPQSPLGLIDVSRLLSVCTPYKSSSVNLLNALISIGIARKAASKYSVGVITPYNAHSRLLATLCLDTIPAGSKPVSCATVHRFQGSEEDIILFDAVDSYPKREPGELLKSHINKSANRLFIVALTRAKGKFISIANAAYLTDKALPRTTILKQYLDSVPHEAVRTSKEVLAELAEENAFTPSTPYYCFPDYLAASDAYLSDLNHAKSDLHIEITRDCLIDERQASNIATVCKRLNANRKDAAVIRISHGCSIPKELVPFAFVGTDVLNPLTIIDREIIWYGEPLSSFSLSDIGASERTEIHPVFRIISKKTVVMLWDYLGLNSISNIPVVEPKRERIVPHSPAKLPRAPRVANIDQLFQRGPTQQEIDQVRAQLISPAEGLKWQDYYWSAKLIAKYDEGSAEPQLIADAVGEAFAHGLKDNNLEQYIDALQLRALMLAQLKEYDKQLDALGYYIDAMDAAGREVPPRIFHEYAATRIHIEKDLGQVLRKPQYYFLKDLNQVAKDIDASEDFSIRRRIFIEFLALSSSHLEINPSTTVDWDIITRSASQYHALETDEWRSFIAYKEPGAGASQEAHSLSTHEDMVVGSVLDSGIDYVRQQDQHLHHEKEDLDKDIQIAELQSKLAEVQRNAEEQIKRQEEESAKILQRTAEEHQENIRVETERRKALEKALVEEKANSAVLQNMLEQNTPSLPMLESTDDMADLLASYRRRAARLLADRLKVYLDQIAGNQWWDKCVATSLTNDQMMVAQYNHYRELEDFDLAALVRIAKCNWNTISNRCQVNPEGERILIALGTIRNKGAHESAKAPALSYIRASMETLVEFFEAFGAEPSLLDQATQYLNTLKSYSGGEEQDDEGLMVIEDNTEMTIKYLEYYQLQANWSYCVFDKHLLQYELIDVFRLDGMPKKINFKVCTLCRRLFFYNAGETIIPSDFALTRLELPESTNKATAPLHTAESVTTVEYYRATANMKKCHFDGQKLVDKAIPVYTRASTQPKKLIFKSCPSCKRLFLFKVSGSVNLKDYYVKCLELPS